MSNAEPRATSDDDAATPPLIAVLATSNASLMAPVFKIIGKNNIALTSVLPLNFLLHNIAINKLKNIIKGTSITTSLIDETKIWLNSGSSNNENLKLLSPTNLSV